MAPLIRGCKHVLSQRQPISFPNPAQLTPHSVVHGPTLHWRHHWIIDIDHCYVTLGWSSRVHASKLYPPNLILHVLAFALSAARLQGAVNCCDLQKIVHKLDWWSMQSSNASFIQRIYKRDTFFVGTSYCEQHLTHLDVPAIRACGVHRKHTQ